MGNMMEARTNGWSESTDGMRIDWDVPLKMSDGVVLRGDVFRPDDNGKYPVILAVTPYNKWSSFPKDEPWTGQWKRLCDLEPDVLRLSSNRYQNYECVDPERFVPEGYAIVRVDVRGTGRSPGFMDLMSTRETQDLFECIEWAGTQPWSTGRVGMSGVSYLAWNQWHVASLQPRHLKAICVWEGCSDFYREFYRHGGILCQFPDAWITKYVWPGQHGLGERGRRSGMNGEWMSGPLTLSDEELALKRRDWREDSRANPLATDEFWRARSPDFSKITVPLLSAANWGGHGLHLRGNVEGFLRARSEQKWLNFHCLEHWTEFYKNSGIELQKRFFGHFLQDKDTGWGSEPRVQMQVRHPTEPFQQKAAPQWPLPNTEWRKLYLEPTTCGLVAQPPKSDATLKYGGFSDGLTFLTTPAQTDLRLIGPSAVKLYLSSSTMDADVFVVLRLFDANLKEVAFSGANEAHTPIAHGWLRASARKLDIEKSLPYRPYHTHDEHQPLVPGQIYELDIEIWPTSVIVPAGYRLGVSIRGKDYEFVGDRSVGSWDIGLPSTGVGPFRHVDDADRPAAVFNNEVTIHFKKNQPLYILIPIIPGSD